MKTEEEKIRKKWLISLFMFAAMCWMVTFGMGLDILSLSKLVLGGFGLDKFYIYFILFISTIVLIPNFCIPYHCAYKKKGSGWLMWTMIMLPLGILKEVNDLFPLDKNESLVFCLNVTWIGIIIYYWINCRILYKINSNQTELA